MTNKLITLKNVGFEDDSKSILSNISLDILAGEITTIIGPNGAGKSSLVKLISGLEQASSGILWRHQDTRIGYMPQRLNIQSNLPMSAERFLLLANRNKKAVAAATLRYQIDDFKARPINKLSGGELQRLLLARAALRSPNLLILDEPTQGVDLSGQAEIYDLIEALRDDSGCAVIMVSHDLHLVMAKTDNVLCLNHHICCRGAPESVAQHPEYLELFGRETGESIAVYTHHHDHTHDLHGDIVKNTRNHNE